MGEIIIGTVHQVQRDNVFVNIDQAELRMPKKEQIRSERYRRGDTVRAVIKSVEITSRGPDIVISRSDNHFLYKMFEMEVPEIEDGIIEISRWHMECIGGEVFRVLLRCASVPLIHSCLRVESAWAAILELVLGQEPQDVLHGRIIVDQRRPGGARVVS